MKSTSDISGHMPSSVSQKRPGHEEEVNEKDVCKIQMQTQIQTQDLAMKRKSMRKMAAVHCSDKVEDNQD